MLDIIKMYMDNNKGNNVITTICNDIINSSKNTDINYYIENIVSYGYMESDFNSIIIEYNSEKFFNDNKELILSMINKNDYEEYEEYYGLEPKLLIANIYENICYKLSNLIL